MHELRADVAVVGLGAMGAATLYQLARSGIAAIGIDRFAPPHAMGSSHGETRVTRCAVGEGDAYVPLVRRSHAIWRELEAETGETLLEACGLLMLARRGIRTGHHGTPDFLNRTAAIAARHAIPHERLDTAGIAARFPTFALTGDENGYFEPGAGLLHPERCIGAALRRATERGAAVLTNRRVVAIETRAGSVRIALTDGAITADRVVVAAGAWTGRLLGPPFAATLLPYRQMLHWFPAAEPAAYRPGAFPTFLWMHGARPEDYFYGFPALPGTAAVKVATEQYGATCDPDAMPRLVGAGEAAAMHAAHVAGRLPGIAAAPARSAACLYTVTPDSGFIIDRMPGNPRILVIAACSGHGFKHSAAIGEAVAQWIGKGSSDIDLAPFRLDRLDAARQG